MAGCSNGAATCSGNIRNAMNPLTGQIVTAAGAANTQALIGTPVPGTGTALNGIVQAGHGIANTNYIWPTLVVGPRFGFAYDVTGKSDLGDPRRLRPVLRPARREHGILDSRQSTGRDDTGPVQRYPGDSRHGGLSPLPVPALVTFQYNAQGSVVTSVECRRPEIAAFPDGRGCVVCRQPRV